MSRANTSVKVTISFAFDGNMSLFIILLSASVFLHCCVFGVYSASLSNEHKKLTNNHGLNATNTMNVSLTSLSKNEVRQIQGNYHIPPFIPGYKPQRCPLCDSSVYSYCDEKLLHDACCCVDSHELPYQCRLANCQFLHANSCREHRFIAICCCNDNLRAALKNLAQA